MELAGDSRALLLDCEPGLLLALLLGELCSRAELGGLARPRRERTTCGPGSAEKQPNPEEVTDLAVGIAVGDECEYAGRDCRAGEGVSLVRRRPGDRRRDERYEERNRELVEIASVDPCRDPERDHRRRGRVERVPAAQQQGERPDRRQDVEESSHTRMGGGDLDLRGDGEDDDHRIEHVPAPQAVEDPSHDFTVAAANPHRVLPDDDPKIILADDSNRINGRRFRCRTTLACRA